MEWNGNTIEARGIRKSFGSTEVLKGIDLRVERGTVYALLGPNGAGKTTLVHILSTLLRPDGGSAAVFGLDVVQSGDAVRRRIGLTGQFAAVDESLTGLENLILFGRLLGYPKRDAAVRAEEWLSVFGLTEAAGKPAGTYSGGMRRRLDIAAAMLVKPDLLFLDEPTTGLDPRSRNEVWDIVRTLTELGTTVLLTTQYLEEADRLSNRIAVLNEGVVIAEGTPAELKASVGSGTIRLQLARKEQRGEAEAVLQRVLGIPVRSDSDQAVLTVPAPDPKLAAQALLELTHSGIELDQFSLGQPSLDEVFLALTGQMEEDPVQSDSKEVHSL